MIIFVKWGHNLNLNFDDNIDFDWYLPVRDFECFNDFEPATLPEIKNILFEYDDLSSGCDAWVDVLAFGKGHSSRRDRIHTEKFFGGLRNGPML